MVSSQYSIIDHFSHGQIVKAEFIYKSDEDVAAFFQGVGTLGLSCVFNDL